MNLDERIAGSAPLLVSASMGKTLKPTLILVVLGGHHDRKQSVNGTVKQFGP